MYSLESELCENEMDLNNFMCSHLAAHQSEFEKRNQDFHDISGHMTFSAYERQSLDYPPRFRRFKDFNHVFWLGDLNYRIDDFDIVEVNYSSKGFFPSFLKEQASCFLVAPFI